MLDERLQALLLAVVFVAFATAQVSVVKVFGVGLTIAVLVDAFLIRTLLVPAFMKMAGRANWWAPRPLRRFHLRYGIWETDPSSVLDLLDRAEHARQPQEHEEEDERTALTPGRSG